MQIIEALMPFAWPDPPTLPGFQGRKAIAGRIGRVVFIATEDHDGQIEVSLAAFDARKKSRTPSRPCSERQAAWFFSKIGATPVEGVRTRTTRHFVIRRGAVKSAKICRLPLACPT